MVNCLYTIVSEGCLLLGGRVYEPGSDIVSDFPQELKLPRSSPPSDVPAIGEGQFCLFRFREILQTPHFTEPSRVQ